MSHPIQTVNVIKFRSLDPPNIISHTAWRRGVAGSRAAEAHFVELVKEQKGDLCSNEELVAMIDDGYCEVGEGAILLTHTC